MPSWLTTSCPPPMTARTTSFPRPKESFTARTSTSTSSMAPSGRRATFTTSGTSECPSVHRRTTPAQMASMTRERSGSKKTAIVRRYMASFSTRASQATSRPRTCCKDSSKARYRAGTPHRRTSSPSREQARTTTAFETTRTRSRRSRSLAKRRSRTLRRPLSSMAATTRRGAKPSRESVIATRLPDCSHSKSRTPKHNGGMTALKAILQRTQ